MKNLTGFEIEKLGPEKRKKLNNLKQMEHYAYQIYGPNGHLISNCIYTSVKQVTRDVALYVASYAAQGHYLMDDHSRLSLLELAERLEVERISFDPTKSYRRYLEDNIESFVDGEEPMSFNQFLGSETLSEYVFVD